MYDNNRYTLERYRAGGANRYTCPNCGKKRCFTRYVDTATSEYLADDCGKCDHEASCGYHYPPRELFRDHPELRPSPDWVPGQPQQHPRRIIIPERNPQEVFFDQSMVDEFALCDSTFARWIRSLPLDKDRVEEVLEMYYVGGTAYDIYVEGRNRGPAVVFWQIDEQQRVHDAKMIAYSPSGHRVQGWGNWMRAYCEQKHIGPQMAGTDKVLFGLHLLNAYPDATVCIVESEKTAILCACVFPQFVWMATGGCGNLQTAKLKPLQGRRVKVYPDSGCYQSWRDRLEKVQGITYTISDTLERYPKNTDIADLLLERLIKRQPAKDQVAAKRPTRQLLAKKQSSKEPPRRSGRWSHRRRNY